MSSTSSSASPTISIIVVNYRTRDLTLECLRSIVRETKDTSYEILLVDNASDDGTIEAVRSELPSVRCFPLAENVGFAGANNIAAKETKGRQLLLLNPDTVVLDHAIDRLVAFSSKRPRAGIWGGQSLRGDLSLDPTSCWGRVTLWSVICKTFGITAAFPNSAIFNPEGYGGWDRLTEREVDIVCGCFMLIDRDLWNRLGGFDGIFFMYGEEADFCMRAAKAGARPTFTPSATIIHYGGASHQMEVEKIIRGLSARSELIARHFSPAIQSLGLFVNSLLPLVRSAGYSIAARVSRSDRMMTQAHVWWSVWRRRSSWQSGWSKGVPAPAGG